LQQDIIPIKLIFSMDQNGGLLKHKSTVS
jgi:hypothetical protein